MTNSPATSTRLDEALKTLMKGCTMSIPDHLRKLASGEVEPYRLDKGICDELMDRFGFKARNTLLLAVGWEKHSGSILYPVPGGAEGYLEHEDKWCEHTQQGRDRRELCLYLANEIENEQR